MKETTGRLTCSVEEAAAMLGISRGKAYDCVKRGEIRSVQLGRRIVVPVVAIKELLGITSDPDSAA